MDNTVFIIADQQTTREGIRAILDKVSSLNIVGESEKDEGAMQMVHRLRPDVLIMDISLPDRSEIAMIRRILSETPDVRVLAVSADSSSRYIAETLRAGVRGYLPMDYSAEELINAIQTVAANNAYLCPRVAAVVIASDFYRSHSETRETRVEEAISPRERRVLQLIAERHSTKEIGFLLGISVKTVEGHRAQVMKKLRLYSMAELIKYAIHEGIISLGQESKKSPPGKTELRSL